MRLVASRERRLEGIARDWCRGREAGSGQKRLYPRDPDLVGRVVRDRATVARRLEERLPGLRIARGQQGGTSPAEDPGLLPGDRRERRAELLGVVQADRRDNRQGRRRDVGRIEPSSQSDLEEREVEPAPGECDEGGGRERFEIGHRDLRGVVRGAQHRLERGVELLVGQVGFADPDALAD